MTGSPPVGGITPAQQVPPIAVSRISSLDAASVIDL